MGSFCILYIHVYAFKKPDFRIVSSLCQDNSVVWIQNLMLLYTTSKAGYARHAPGLHYFPTPSRDISGVWVATFYLLLGIVKAPYKALRHL